MKARPFRVLIAKPGLDGHDRGAKIVAKALRDEGFEVIYTGLRNSPEEIATTAIQEDVDAIGLSILSGAHNRLCSRLFEIMKNEGMSDIPIFLGGIIPTLDIPDLKKMGVREVFGPGVQTGVICRTIKQTLSEIDNA
jgi:methylmalonyl-CoA mutase, C-terminal domain